MAAVLHWYTKHQVRSKAWMSQRKPSEPKACVLHAVERAAAQLDGSRASSGAGASTSTASQATAEHTGQVSALISRWASEVISVDTLKLSLELRGSQALGRCTATKRSGQREALKLGLFLCNRGGQARVYLAEVWISSQEMHTE